MQVELLDAFYPSHLCGLPTIPSGLWIHVTPASNSSTLPQALSLSLAPLLVTTVSQ